MMYKIVPLLVIILFSCSPTRHWEKVAADPDVTPRKKAIVADKMSKIFPVLTEYLPGEVTTKVDTISDLSALAELSFMLDSVQKLNRPVSQYEIDSIITAAKTLCSPRIITVYNNRVDTLKVPDARAEYALKKQLDIATTQYNGLVVDLEEQEKKTKAAIGRNKNLWWWIIGLGAALLLSWYFSLKGKIKPWNLLSRS